MMKPMLHRCGEAKKNAFRTKAACNFGKTGGWEKRSLESKWFQKPTLENKNTIGKKQWLFEQLWEKKLIENL